MRKVGTNKHARTSLSFTFSLKTRSQVTVTYGHKWSHVAQLNGLSRPILNAWRRLTIGMTSKNRGRKLTARARKSRLFFSSSHRSFSIQTSALVLTGASPLPGADSLATFSRLDRSSFA
jgi:hypothetical protein